MMTNAEMNATYSKWHANQISKAARRYPNARHDETNIPFMHMLAIGGSTDAALLGVSKWATARDVYDAMVDGADENEGNFMFALGHYMEPFVADEFQKATGMEVMAGMTGFDSNDRPWSMAQFDRLAIENGKTVPLEIKTSAVNPVTADGSRYWGDGCIFEGGELKKPCDLIPPQYFIQVQKQILVANTDHAWLAAWLRYEDKLRIYRIQRDEEIIGKIIEAEDDFMFNHVIPLVPPEDDEPKVIVTEKSDEDVFLNAELESLYKKYKDVAERSNALGKEKAELAEKIRTSMGSHKNAVGNDGTRLFHLTFTTAKRFDSAKFKKENPAMYDEYTTEIKNAPRIIEG